jgi:hypothetical protein
MRGLGSAHPVEDAVELGAQPPELLALGQVHGALACELEGPEVPELERVVLGKALEGLGGGAHAVEATAPRGTRDARDSERTHTSGTSSPSLGTSSIPRAGGGGLVDGRGSACNVLARSASLSQRTSPAGAACRRAFAREPARGGSERPDAERASPRGPAAAVEGSAIGAIGLRSVAHPDRSRTSSLILRRERALRSVRSVACF